MIVKFNTPTESFEKLYEYVMSDGVDFANTKAIFNAAFTVKDPSKKIITTKERKFKEDYAQYEWEWYLKGDRDAKEISEKAKIWKNMMVPYTTEINSNYGHFWNYNDQLDRVINDLKYNKETRRAVLIHYNLFEIDRYKYDTPCNLVLNFYVKEDMLSLTVFARSIDLVFGYCNDQYTFSKLMELVCEKTGYSMGEITWFITNLHIYPRHYNLMDK